eukprot:7266363-Heterocapsa_arctica.AAC.1
MYKLLESRDPAHGARLAAAAGPAAGDADAAPADAGNIIGDAMHCIPADAGNHAWEGAQNEDRKIEHLQWYAVRLIDRLQKVTAGAAEHVGA